MFELEGYSDLEPLHYGLRSLVLRGRRLANGSRVVVKTPRADFPGSVDLRRLRHEFELGRRIEAGPAGAHVVRHLALEPFGSSLALVLEDFGARDLASEVREGGLPLGVFLDRALALARAVRGLHEASLVHLDINPANILYAPDRHELRLCDLSSSVTLGAGGCDEGIFRGTPAYAAPEQVQGTGFSLDSRADLYSLGVTLFQLLAGRLPFVGADALETRHLHLATAAPSIREARPDVPPVVAAILLRLLSKNPEERYASAAGLVNDLSRCWQTQITQGDVPSFDIGQVDRSPRLTIPQRIYGRDNELVDLTAALEDAVGGANVLVFVAGEPGIGKSVLVEALRGRVQAQGGQFCAGKFEQLLSNVPYSGFSAALREFLQTVLTRPASEVALWRERITHALEPNAQLLVSLVPELAGLIGAQPEVTELEPEQAQARFGQLVLNLARAIARKNNPLVVFLDDLQWCDQASLAQIEQLVTAEDLGHLLLIGAYRSTEVNAAHPVSVLAARLAAKRPVVTIELAQLDSGHVEQMVADSICEPIESCRPLAQLVHRKTRGNPFFLSQFLRMLHSERLLWFESSLGLWRCDLAACEAQRITDNVVDLMVRRIHRLGARCQEMLRHASCIGTEFDSETLARVLGSTESTVQASLAEALSDQLVIPLPLERPLDDRGGPTRYRFLHDQVQQAAYALIAEPARPPLHLAIGRLLMNRASADELEDKVFLVLDQLGRGLSLIVDGKEQERVAELCLHAGRRAKTANAYAASIRYLDWGLQLLGPDPWQRSYETALALYAACAESSYLDGQLPEMEQALEAIIAHCRTLLERVPAYQLRLTAVVARNDVAGAITLARQVLAELGVRLPANPTNLGVAARLARTSWRMHGVSADALLSRTPTQDRRVLSAMQILASVLAPAYVSSPKLFPVVICEMIQLTLEHGTSAWAPEAFLGWGVIEIAAFGSIRRGYEIGGVAPRLVAALDAKPRRARIQTTFNFLIRHWIEPLRNTLEPLKNAVEDAVQQGDFASAALAAATAVFWSLACGLPLSELDELALEFDQLLLRLGQDRYRQDIRRMIQLIRCLQGRAPDPKRLRGEYFDVESGLRTASSAGDRANIASISYESALLCYLYGDFPGALTHAERTEQHLDSVLGTVYPPLLELLISLVRTRLLVQSNLRATRRQLSPIRRSLRRLERWALMAPENQQHRVHLVRASLASLRGDTATATREFESAVDLAGRYGNGFERAIALECAGRFHHHNQHDRIAAATVRAARDAWVAWGAEAKARSLEAEFAGLISEARSLPGAPLPLLLGAREHPGVGLMDTASVLKASQAIVGEIRLPLLVRRLLTLAMENSGAQRGVLLLMKAGRLWIEAAADVDQPELLTGVGSLTETAEAESLLPVSVVEYVARVGEPLLETDLSSNPRFTHDPYIGRQNPLSALCVPLISQGVLGGLVYLENRRLRGAFSSERFEVLKVIASLAAISLQNARLYEDVARAHARQVQLTEAQSRFVPAEFLRNLQRDSILDVALGDNIRKEMSILFSDVRGFTRLVERMSPQQHIGFINSYLGHMEPAIVENGGFVDSYLGDGIMALFENAPDTALRAAINMSAELIRFNANRDAAGLGSIEMGVGISTGPLTLGTIGGPMRIKCGVIGDPVNVASRVESLTKQFGCFLLVTHLTCEGLKEPQDFSLRRVDRVRLLGKTTPVTLYEVLDAEPARRRAGKERTLGHYDEAMSAYLGGRFAEAKRLFESCLVVCPDDGASLLLAHRCEVYASNAPPAWDGVFTHTSKS